MFYYRNPVSRDEARDYYNTWINLLFSWDEELAREMIDGGGPQGIVCTSEAPDLAMPERLYKLALYKENGPPGSSINDLARAAFCQLLLKSVPIDVATSSVELGQFRIMNYAQKLINPEINLDF